MAVALIGLTWGVLPHAGGAELKLSLLGGGVDYPIVAVNAGDTVTWAYASGSPGFAEEYGGRWRSPVLTKVGDSHSFTFTDAGFYAYRTAAYTNTITLLPALTPPPAITLNFPLDGFRFGSGQGASIPLLATATNVAANIVRIDFLAGTNVIGTAIEPPYHLAWTDLAPYDGLVALTVR